MDVFLGWTPGPLEIVLIAMAALLLFGKRLPELARSLGKGVTEFKKGLSGVEDEVKKSLDDSGNGKRDEDTTPHEG